MLFIVKNYEGDVMNFDMAAEMAAELEIEAMSVKTNDDVAVEDSLFTTGRRGVAGTLVVEKIVGAAAEEGRDLKSLKALGDSVNGRTRSMGVALTSCTVPAAGKPTFDIGEDEMEMGVGIHGEPGRRRVKLKSADAIVEEMMAAILGDLGAKSGEALLLVNGFGATPAMELYLIYNAARKLLEKHGLTAARSLGRQLRDLARHGRLLADGLPARRGIAASLGRPGPYRRAQMGDVDSRGQTARLTYPTQPGVAFGSGR